MRQRDGVISEAIYYVRRPRRPRRGLLDLSNKCYISLRKQSVGVNESLSRKLTMTNNDSSRKVQCFS